MRKEVDGWTGKLVGEALVDALRWAQLAAGPVGPGRVRSMRLPETVLSLEQRLGLGWGLPEVADKDDIPPMIIRPSATQVSRHMAALAWPAVYLADADGSRHMVSLWAGCKARRVSFSEAVKHRGTMDRSAAYRLRDRGLTLIAIGLTRDRVPIECE